MKNLLIFTVSLFFAITLNAQDKTYEFNIEKGRELIKLQKTHNGLQFLKTGKPKAMMTTHKDVKLICLNNNLEENYNVNIKTQVYLTHATNYGKYFYNINQIINSKGEVKEYDFSEKKIKKLSQINPIFKFYNDYGYTLIGPEIGRKNYKKKYTDNDLKIFTLRNEDFKEISNVLEVPKISFKNLESDEAVSWFKGEVFEDKFIMISKDTPEDETYDTYNLAEYDFEGSLVRHIELTTNLDGDYLLRSRCGGVPVGTNPAFGSGASFGNISINKIDDTYTVYGFYTGSDKEQIRSGKAKGLYLFKFNGKGELLWKNKYPFKEISSEYLLYRTLGYFEINNKGYLRFSIEKDDVNIYAIDKGNGNIESKSYNIFEDFKENKGNYSGKEIGSLNAVYSTKDHKKKYFSYSVVQSLFIRNDIKGYLEGISSKNYFYYDGDYLEDGSYILKEFDKKGRKIKFMKFNKE